MKQSSVLHRGQTRVSQGAIIAGLCGALAGAPLSVALLHVRQLSITATPTTVVVGLLSAAFGMSLSLLVYYLAKKPSRNGQVKKSGLYKQVYDRLEAVNNTQSEAAFSDAELEALNSTQSEAAFSDAELEHTLPQLLESRPVPRERESFADIVARQVPEVDTGAFPATRDASELDHEDLWSVALAALDERFEFTDSMHIADEYGEYGALEPIDGLEDPTDVLFFRAPGGHPEVVDTDSYINYLIGQEFMRNGSNVAWSNARDYLHVIDGNTKRFESLAERNVGRDDLLSSSRYPQVNTAPHKPRHMKQESAPYLMAQEA